MDWLAQGTITIVVGLAVWYLTSRVEAIRRETAKLQDERGKIYAQVLEPYIRLFAGTKDSSETEKAMTQVTSFEYRRALFQLNIMGSDDVILAMNRLMQYFYASERDSTPPELVEILPLWATVLLTIRRDLGNEGTKLEKVDMLRGQIKDIDQLMT